jgi:excisionase family DNA binding protein
MLNLAEATIRKWIRDGELKAVKLGRGYVINIEGFSTMNGKLIIEQREE